MTLPDWALNGTTLKDLGTVADFSMLWNFNTREKARLTGGLLRIYSDVILSILSLLYFQVVLEQNIRL